MQTVRLGNLCGFYARLSHCSLGVIERLVAAIDISQYVHSSF